MWINRLIDRRHVLTGSAAITSLAFLKWLPASAQTSSGTLVVALGGFPNGLDIDRPGSNRPSYMTSMMLYDRLVGFGIKTGADGVMTFDPDVITPELAESWTVAPDKKSITFKLRQNATFASGNLVTAKDVKYSFDRHVGVGGFPPAQMKAGSMEKPEQFVVVDDHTFRIDFPVASKLSLPDIAVPTPYVLDSEEVKKHATEKDPWGIEYVSKNHVGGGAYLLESYQPGQQIVLRRNDKWKSGRLPAIEQVVLRQVPSSSTRRALVERGGVDVNFDIPPKDAREQLQAQGKVKVTGGPIANTIHGIGLNFNFPPLNNLKVRQAIAHAIPYDQIFEAAAYGRGEKLYGGTWPNAQPPSIAWPQKFPYHTDLDKARALMKDAGISGFETVIGINIELADWMEPTALLIQDAIVKIGIKARIDKIPGANWRTFALIEKKVPINLTNFGGWLDYCEYYCFFQYHAASIFNSMAYKNDEVEKIIADTLHMPKSGPDYKEKIARLIKIVSDDVPMIPLYQPFLDVAMQPNVKGYVSYYHRQLDARSMQKT
jgi:peptide/nickel transport system substrate-binding protein